MSLETTDEDGSLLVVLFPPGNLAAELAALRRELFRSLGAPAALPFPCAAPLGWICPDSAEDELAVAAAKAPRIYDTFALASGFLFLTPAGMVEDGTESGPEVITHQKGSTPTPGFPLPCGRGFPLAYFRESRNTEKILAGLPPPPRLSFRTFQAAALRIRCTEPWTAGMVWETLSIVRYPLRIPKRG